MRPTALTIEEVKTIYRQAIDPGAHDLWGEDWWSAVAEEVVLVVSAPSAAAGAKAIEWWHWNWSQVGDSAIEAARRLRRAAATQCHYANKSVRKKPVRID